MIPPDLFRPGMIEPHGGHLVERTVEGDHAMQLREEYQNIPTIPLDFALFQDMLNLASGRFSPLSGFMTRNDFLKVVHDMTLEDGTIWPLPIVLDVDKNLAAELEMGGRAGLESPDGTPVGVIDIDEIFRYDKHESAANVFGTDDPDHTGVRNYLAKDDFLVGGPIRVFEDDLYADADIRPKESRVLFDRLGWESVVGFQTRNAPHRAHEYIQKSALEHVDGLLVQPKLGEKKSGDYRDEVILGAYRELIDLYYPENMAVLSMFPSAMRYAGPREAVFDALVRKNQGCTHFIIGRDHAGVEDYYDGFDAHHIFDSIGNIGIEPLLFNYSFFCKKCDSMVSEKICPHPDEQRVYPSGTKIREAIRNGERPSEKLMRPEVVSFIMDEEQTFVN